MDDEAPLVGLLTSYLEREGFAVATAADGARAVELARELDPEVIVLDLMLPGIDGVKACRQIRTFSDAYIVGRSPVPTSNGTPRNGAARPANVSPSPSGSRLNAATR